MEHIVQFAIGIDDKAIQNRIEEHAYSDVLDKLTKKRRGQCFRAHQRVFAGKHVEWIAGGRFAKLPRRTQGRDHRQGREHARRPVPTNEEISGSHGRCHRKGR
nr:hypothetical protein [Bifidobacterium breve]